MSEKRFTIKSTATELELYDNGVKIGEFPHYEWVARPVDYVVKTLNEQQDTIFKLQDLCGKSDGENMKLRIENKRLEKEVNLLRPTNLEQYEQIQKLQEENEQLKNKYNNLGISIEKTVEDLKKKEEVYLAEFNIIKRITEYEKELFDE